MDKRGKISALIERLRVYRFEIDGEEINAGDVMQKLVDAASEPIDQHMLNDLFDFIEEVAAGEHSTKEHRDNAYISRIKRLGGTIDQIAEKAKIHLEALGEKVIGATDKSVPHNSSYWSGEVTLVDALNAIKAEREAPSDKRREARRAAVTLLEIIDDGEVWRVALNAMFRVLNASDDAEHWTTVSEARSALKAALRAVAEDG